jgi:hypothetical protein
MLDSIALEMIDNGYNELRRANMLIENVDEHTLLEARNCIMYAGIEYFDVLAYAGPTKEANELKLAVDMMSDQVGRYEYTMYHVPLDSFEF